MPIVSFPATGFKHGINILNMSENNWDLTHTGQTCPMFVVVDNSLKARLGFHCWCSGNSPTPRFFGHKTINHHRPKETFQLSISNISLSLPPNLSLTFSLTISLSLTLPINLFLPPNLYLSISLSPSRSSSPFLSWQTLPGKPHKTAMWYVSVISLCVTKFLQKSLNV